MVTANVSFVTNEPRVEMNTKLNNETITLDKNEVFKNPKAEATQWLRERKERNMKIEEMTAEECYDMLDKLAIRRSVEGRGSSPEASHAKWYCDTMRAKVKKRLKQLGAPATRPGDGRVYGPGQAAWQRAGLGSHVTKKKVRVCPGLTKPQFEERSF